MVSVGRYQEKETTENWALDRKIFVKPLSRHRARRGALMRDEVIKVDSTHHAIGKIGQHVCFVYGGGTSIG
jgi:hypothetical protein